MVLRASALDRLTELDRIDDLNLPASHPKKIFIRLALEQEIRLSYYDRIVKTLPPQFQDAEAGAIADQAPGPEYDYELPCTWRHIFSLALHLTYHQPHHIMSMHRASSISCVLVRSRKT